MCRVPLPLALALLGSVGAGGCVARDAGVVELAWVFVDRNGDPIYPGGVFSIDAERNSCDLPGSTADGSLRFDLQVQLEICDPDCAAGCDDPECLVMDPLRFPCNTSRGNEREVPASDQPYRFTVRPVLDSNVAECTDPEPTCIGVPGPRERKVTAGLVTDLQVYQIAVDIPSSGTALDLEACGCV